MGHAPAIFGEGGRRLQSALAVTRLGQSAPIRLFARVIQEMAADDATHMAASVSYYAVLSLFPLILALTAIVGWMVESPARQEELVIFVVEYLPGSEQFVRENVQGIQRLRETLGVIALFGLIWSASAVFGSITRVVNRAWDVRENPPFYKNKPRQLAMALGVGALFLVSLGLTSFLQWATTVEIGDRTAVDLLGGKVFAILLRLPALAVSFSIFLTIYKYLPNTRTYWSYVWPGAALAAVLFEIGKSLFLWYLENLASFDQVYGNLASVIVLMVWTYFCALILILGAEFASEYGRFKRGVERGALIHRNNDPE